MRQPLALNDYKTDNKVKGILSNFLYNLKSVKISGGDNITCNININIKKKKKKKKKRKR